MKKILSCILAVVLLCTFSLFALGSLENEEVDVTDKVVGNYESFSLAVEDTVYQGGISLTETYVLSSSANYDYDNKSKKIKSGATVEIEVAYKLEDTITDIEVEIKDGSIFGDSDDVINKTFSIK